jgi:hypothetical protein
MTFSAVSTAVRRGPTTHRIDRGNMFRCVRGPPHNAMNSADQPRSSAGALRRALLASAVRRVMVTGVSRRAVGRGSRKRPAGVAGDLSAALWKSRRRGTRGTAGGALGEPPAGHSENRRRGSRGTADGAVAASCPHPPGNLLMPLQSIPYGLVSCAYQTSSVTTVTGRGRGSQRRRAQRRRTWRGVSGGANGAALCERRGATGLFRGDRPSRSRPSLRCVGAVGALRAATQFT